MAAVASSRQNAAAMTRHLRALPFLLLPFTLLACDETRTYPPRDARVDDVPVFRAPRPEAGPADAAPADAGPADAATGGG